LFLSLECLRVYLEVLDFLLKLEMKKLNSSKRSIKNIVHNNSFSGFDTKSYFSISSLSKIISSSSTCKTMSISKVLALNFGAFLFLPVISSIFFNFQIIFSILIIFLFIYSKLLLEIPIVLERLVDEHEIIQHLIKHRTLSKLLSTYIDALPNLINEKTGRVHTNFNQASTATGRLSSSNPNLQNIPVRTEFSRRIRKAFLPEKNWKLLSADYSQIELRILAHLADEEILINAFHKNDDIHSLTARLIFEKEEISSDERRVGKTINFGVIYGMGIKKFARSTGVSTPEAKEFLIKYKERYSKIFKFLELQERLALSIGYVKTIFGRKREFKFDKNGLGRLIGKDPYEIDLQSARSAGMEAQSLRAAANAPIQGSSADIIKIAMVQLNKKLIEMNVPAKMLLQVHDELLFEVEPDSLEITTKLVKKTMEDCVKLNVPLLVDIGIGDNWMETK